MRADPLTDDDPMPFGKHKGIRMSDVPARYFHWLWNNKKKQEVNTDAVAAYIHTNMTELEKEYPDGIWDKPI